MKKEYLMYFVISLFLPSFVEMYGCGFCEMWCLVRVGDNWTVDVWWVESGGDG